MPYGDILDPDNRYALLKRPIPREGAEETYAPQPDTNAGAPAKPARLDLGSLYIKRPLILANKEIVPHSKGNTCIQFRPGLSDYSGKAPLGPSTADHFRKQFPDDELRQTHGLVTYRDKKLPPKAAAIQRKDDDRIHGDDADKENRPSFDRLIEPSGQPKGKNWGTLSIGISRIPADTAYLADPNH